MDRYFRIFNEAELDKSTQIFTDAKSIVDEIKNDQGYTDELNGLMAQVNTKLKSYMQKRKYVQEADVSNFAEGIQKTANEYLTQKPELSSALVTLCLLLSYQLKVNEAKPAENTQPETAAPAEAPPAAGGTPPA